MFIWEICGCSFPIQVILYGHSRCHNVKELLCDVFSVMVTGKLALKNHMRKHKNKKIPLKNDKKEWKCSMCSYLTTRKSNFERHKETCGKPKPKVTHECSLCKKVFLRKDFYLRHIKIHYDKVNKKNWNLMYAP